MERHPDSHLDHGLTEPQIAYLFNLFAGREGFFIETIELPVDLGTVPCGLHGPVMGDAPITELEVTHATRGDRTYTSRLVARPLRWVRSVTVIAGPHDGLPCVLFTAFGGPLAQKETGDPSLGADARAKAVAFWNEHALSK